MLGERKTQKKNQMINDMIKWLKGLFKKKKVKYGLWSHIADSYQLTGQMESFVKQDGIEPISITICQDYTSYGHKEQFLGTIIYKDRR